MSRVVIIGNEPRMLVNFRGSLIRAVVDAGHEVTAMSMAAEGNEIAAIEEMGAVFRAFPARRHGLNPFTDLATFIAFRRTFRELRPDVVLAYTVKPVVWAGLALQRIPGVRFYALISGLGFAFYGRGAGRRFLTGVVMLLYRKALQRASGVMFQNPDNRDVFVANRLADPRICSVLNGSGVDLLRFRPSPVPREGMVFLTIARLLGEKGLREYAEAARRVKERHPESRFQLVGAIDPSPDGIPITEVRAWESNGWIEYLGQLADVRPVLELATILVLPSYHEGMPRSVLEGLAVGRPILTTDVSGCRETVVPGENGFLVPSKDASSLADRMIWFIENPHMLSQMGKRSREIAEERFDVREVNRRMLELMLLTN